MARRVAGWNHQADRNFTSRQKLTTHPSIKFPGLQLFDFSNSTWRIVCVDLLKLAWFFSLTSKQSKQTNKQIEKYRYRHLPPTLVLHKPCHFETMHVHCIVSRKNQQNAWIVLAVPKFIRELGQVSNFNSSINWHHHMKDHVEIGHLTKYDAFRMNRHQVMDLEMWFKFHTNVSTL